MKKMILFFSFFSVITFASFPALACGVHANTPKRLAQRQLLEFQKLDTNNDKAITIGEYVTGLSKGKKGGDVNVHPFIKADQNKSGDVSFEEWQIFRPLDFYKQEGEC